MWKQISRETPQNPELLGVILERRPLASMREVSKAVRLLNIMHCTCFTAWQRANQIPKYITVWTKKRHAKVTVYRHQGWTLRSTANNHIAFHHQNNIVRLSTPINTMQSPLCVEDSESPQGVAKCIRSCTSICRQTCHTACKNCTVWPGESWCVVLERNAQSCDFFVVSHKMPNYWAS